MNAFFAYLYRLRFIQRWSLMRNAVPESVAGHFLTSADVRSLDHKVVVVPPLSLAQTAQDTGCAGEPCRVAPPLANADDLSGSVAICVQPRGDSGKPLRRRHGSRCPRAGGPPLCSSRPCSRT